MEKTLQAVETSETIDWKSIYETLLPRVFHFFFYKVGDTLTAEELTAVTFEKAWSGRSRFRKDVGEFRFWVFGIAQKVVADHFRKRKDEVSLSSISIPSNQNVEREIEKRIDYERLASILSSLSERERLLISLKYGAELNNREISRNTGLSEVNVATILFRAVAKLRKEWEKDNG
jgi:RNA polymerase sigma factor (sigma-70 family)